MGSEVLTSHQRSMLRILQECAQRQQTFYPTDDGFVPTPGLQREIICDADLQPLVGLQMLEKRRIAQPTCLGTFATHAWRITEAGRLALAQAQQDGGRDGK